MTVTPTMNQGRRAVSRHGRARVCICVRVWVCMCGRRRRRRRRRVWVCGLHRGWRPATTAAGQRGRQAGRRADRQTDRQTDREAGRQAGRQAGGQAVQMHNAQCSSAVGQGGRAQQALRRAWAGDVASRRRVEKEARMEDTEEVVTKGRRVAAGGRLLYYSAPELPNRCTDWDSCLLWCRRWCWCWGLCGRAGGRRWAGGQAAAPAVPAAAATYLLGCWRSVAQCRVQRSAVQRGAARPTATPVERGSGRPPPRHAADAAQRSARKSSQEVESCLVPRRAVHPWLFSSLLQRPCRPALPCPALPCPALPCPAMLVPAPAPTADCSSAQRTEGKRERETEREIEKTVSRKKDWKKKK